MLCLRDWTQQAGWNVDDSDYDHNITAANASAARFILHVPKYVQYTGCFILNTTESETSNQIKSHVHILKRRIRYNRQHERNTKESMQVIQTRKLKSCLIQPDNRVQQKEGSIGGGGTACR